MGEPVTRVPSLRVANARGDDTSRLIPDEVPVALVYDGSTHAVMMATPADLDDFALGFSLTEGVIQSIDELRELEVVEHGNGIEARLWLVPQVGRMHAERRRRITGPTACGLCGVESLEAAVPEPRRVGSTARAAPLEIQRALAEMPAAQSLNIATRAVHAAAFWDSTTSSLALLREDVGRHNALDKLVGAVARAKLDPGRGFVLLTSRVSVEMVQKTAQLGAEILVAVSAPTALAIRTAEKAGITLIAVARSDAFEIFTHPERVALADTNDRNRPGDHSHAFV
ncbi:MAG: formate dehydrogenase accessory sulfurtransferase FdhD [Hyphomicrobium sp.]|jgi:FdhD protein